MIASIPATGCWFTYRDALAELHAAVRATTPELPAAELVELVTAGRRYRFRSGEVHTMWIATSIGSKCGTGGVIGAEATEDALTCPDCATAVLAEYEASAPAVEAPEAEAAPVLIVIGCGKDKRTEASPAGELYTGQHHRRARAAADALAARIPNARVMILSAKHGLIELADVIAPYDVTFTAGPRVHRGGPVVGTVDDATIARQLRATGARAVVALAGREYAGRLAGAARRIGADVVEPLAGTSGIGPQASRLRQIREGGDLADALLDAVAGPVANQPAESAPAAPALVELPARPVPAAPRPRRAPAAPTAVGPNLAAFVARAHGRRTPAAGPAQLTLFDAA